MGAGSTPDLLGVKRPNLGGAKGNHAINRRLIKAFGPKHGIRNKRCFSSPEAFQNPAPILTGALYMFGCDAVVPAKRGESL